MAFTGRSAALGHSLAIARLRTTPEALLAVLSETVGLALITPELGRVLR
jgi:hypothetical protein